MKLRNDNSGNYAGWGLGITTFPKIAIMRLDKKTLKKRCREPLSVVSFLNLSGLDLDVLEHLGHCRKLHWLIARDNAFQGDEGISRLKQLWYLDLSNNQIQNVNNLSKFLALGTLILSNNNLKWSHLERLSHAHIMSLSLHGNPNLDSDPYYRIHVIDSLPLIWELDGRLVTVTERLHVKQFFIDTQFTEHPVRHKTCKTFQTTTLKNIGTEGIVSKECKYIYSKFPMSEKHTKHTDERRLKYLANMVQDDINELLDEANLAGPINTNFLNDLLQERHKDVERCNMVLLLLVITLEFQLPTGLIRAALVSAQLDMIGYISTMSLFLLPREHRARVVSVLLNAAKVDRDNNINNEGGLYPQLFMCLYYTVDQLTWVRQTSRDNMHKIPPVSHKSDFIALMACEAVSLMVQNTKFYSYFKSESGVVSLVTAATGSVDVILDIKDKLLDVSSMMGGPEQEVNEAINQMLLHAIEIRLSTINIKMADIPVGDRYLSLSDSLPIKPLHSVIWASNFLSKGLVVPRTDPPILRPTREAMKPKPVQPKIGEKVLLGPQVVGELTMLMEGDVAMARIDEVPVANGAVVRKLKSADAHFTFVDMKSLCYGRDIGMWRPIKTAGDNTKQSPDEDGYSIHSIDDETSRCKHEQKAKDVYTAPLFYKPKDQHSNISLRSAMMGSPSKMASGRPKSSVSLIAPSRRLSIKMVQRVMSADYNYSSSSHRRRNDVDTSDLDQDIMHNNVMDNNLLSPNAAITTTQPKRNTSVESQQKKKRVGSGLSCSSLHQHDNVHYIHGFTPREDSSRSNTISILTSPVISERLEAVIMENVNVDQKRTQDEMHPEKDVATERTAGDEKIHVSTSTPKENPESENCKIIDQDRLEVSCNKDEPAATASASLENNQRTDEAKEDRNVLGPGTEGTDGPTEVVMNSTTGGHSHTGHDGSDEHQLGISDEGQHDNCPLCIAVANGSLIRVTNGDANILQDEYREPEIIPVPQKDNEDENIPRQENEERTTGENISATKDGGEKCFENIENIEPANGADTTPMPVLSSTNGLRLSSGAHQMNKQERPKSAVESYNYYVIQQPQVFASGTSAKMNERNTNNGFKSDFQQQREEAWRRTTRNRRQRPLTAAIMSSSQAPPPQRPSSPSMQQQQQQLSWDPKLKMKITKTDRWLGGGRDLFWESVRKRPKSGHTPGWKEGLPDSMRKRRPASAYMMPLTPRQYSTRSVISATDNYHHHEFAGYDSTHGREFGGKEAVLFMPQGRAIQLSQDSMTHSRQLTTPVSEDGHRPLLVEGVPPPSIPNPSQRYSSRYSTVSSYTNLDFIYENDEAGYEGRPSSQLSFTNDPDIQGYYNSSPRLLEDDNGSNVHTMLFKQPSQSQTYQIVSENSSNPDVYKLCPLHRGMVFPYYANTVMYD